MSLLASHANYWFAIAIMMIGLYGIIAKRNLIKQAIALGIFQTGIFLFFISMAVVSDATAPVWYLDANGAKVDGPFDNPLIHCLMLTAIVVSVSVFAVAIALIINIRRAYGTIEEDEILAQEADDAAVAEPDTP